MRAPVLRVLLGASCVLAGACAPRTLTLPTDPGMPLPDAAAVHAALASACSGVRTLTAELALSGRAGRDRLRGRVLAGFARPDSMRLEGVAPFGAPAFILAANPKAAVLLLPRDLHVVRDAAAEDILAALTGIRLAPADLAAVLTGCVVPAPKPATGVLHGNGWASIALDGDATLYLQRTGAAWQLRAARRGGWLIEYDAWQGSFPRRLRLRSAETVPADARVDMTAEIAQLETNVAIDPEAFTVDVPEDAVPLTIEELRASGPLRGRDTR